MATDGEFVLTISDHEDNVLSSPDDRKRPAAKRSKGRGYLPNLKPIKKQRPFKMSRHLRVMRSRASRMRRLTQTLNSTLDLTT
jgi:hypothetical protein